jgi:hypothetical protein
VLASFFSFLVLQARDAPIAKPNDRCAVAVDRKVSLQRPSEFLGRYSQFCDGGAVQRGRGLIANLRPGEKADVRVWCARA